jgi:hypothetical protein
MPIIRYFGVRKEKVYAEKRLPKFHADIMSGGLDSPADPNIQYEGGLGRFPVRFVPGAYISAGAVETAVDVTSFWYYMWLACGIKDATDSSNVTPVAAEAIGSTDASGNLAGTLANGPVTLQSFFVKDSTTAIVAVDNGGGKVKAVVDVTAEAHPTGVGETTLDYYLTNAPVIPGTFIVDDGVGQVAHDDGAGNIVEDSASGITGTIDYTDGRVQMAGLVASTAYTNDYSYRDDTADRGTLNYVDKTFSLVGLGASEAHTADYDYGLYKHVIRPQGDVKLPSFTAALGKDFMEQVFPGCAIGTLSFTVEKELAMVSLDIVGGEDQKETIKDLEDLILLEEFPMPFHDVSFQYGDYQGVLAAIDCDVDALSLEVANNADAEGGLGLNNRFPCDVYSGPLDISIELTLKYNDTQNKEDFWGGSTGPTESPQEKACKIILDAGAYGNIEIDIPRMIITGNPIQLTGRERGTQTVSIRVLVDTITDTIMEITSNVLADWD